MRFRLPGGCSDFVLCCTGKDLLLRIDSGDAAHGMTHAGVSGFIGNYSTDQKLPFSNRIPYQAHQLTAVNGNCGNLRILGSNQIAGNTRFQHLWCWCARHNFDNQAVSGVPHSYPCQFIDCRTKLMLTF